jgi:hypothetical protein
MSGEINRINPTVVEGAEDIHGAESFDADYSPLNRPSFRWRDNMAQSRRTLDEKQVGDMMRMRRMGRGRYDAETFNAPLSREQVEQLRRRMNYAKGSRPPMRPVENRLAVGQRMKGSMASEGFSDVVGTLIPQPHFIGIEELRREKMKNRDAKDAEMASEGFANVLGTLIPEPHFIGIEELQRERMKNRDAKDAENCQFCSETFEACSCSSRNIRMHSHRDSKGRFTQHDSEETSLGLIGEGNDFGQMEAEEFGAEISDDGIVYVDEDNSIRLAKGSHWMKGIGGMEDYYVDGCMSCHEELDGYRRKYVVSPRERWAYCMECFDEMKGRDDVIIKEAETFGAERRYRYGNRYITRDSKGRFKKNVSVGRSLSADRRRKAKTVKGVGQGGSGDYRAEVFGVEAGVSYQLEVKDTMEGGWEHYGDYDDKQEAINAYYDIYLEYPEVRLIEIVDDYGVDVMDVIYSQRNFDLGAEGDYVVAKRPHHMARIRKDRAVYDPQWNKSNMHTSMNQSGKMYDEESASWVDMNFDDGDVVDLTQEVLAKGGVRVGGMTASAIVLAIAGLSGYYYARR